jgi:hypothetical protein
MSKSKAISVAAALALVIFFSVDVAGGYGEERDARITGRAYYPAHTVISTVCTSDGKHSSCHPVFIYVPDSWSVGVEYDGQAASVSVNEAQYLQAERGLRVVYSYRVGKFTGIHYGGSITPAGNF